MTGTTAAIDVNAGITSEKSATIRNYTTQPRLSKQAMKALKYDVISFFIVV